MNWLSDYNYEDTSVVFDKSYLLQRIEPEYTILVNVELSSIFCDLYQINQQNIVWIC